MNFTYDIALRHDEVFYVQGEFISPYYELSLPAINGKKAYSDRIEINAFYRLNDIFDRFLDRNHRDHPELKTYLFDLLIHMITEVDLRHGMTRRGLYTQKVKEEILAGTLGIKIADDYRSFDKDTQMRLAQFYLLQLETGSSLFIFRKVIRFTFHDAILYRSKENPKEIIIYIEREKTDLLEKQLSFILGMFLPLSFHLTVFWSKHFGIFGIDSTLILDETVLY